MSPEQLFRDAIHKIGGKHALPPLFCHALPCPAGHIRSDAGSLEWRQVAEEGAADTGQHIPGPANAHSRITGPVKPDPASVRDDIHRPFEENGSLLLLCRRFYCPGPATGVSCITGERMPARDPGKLTGMRGVQRLLSCLRERQP